MRKNIFFGAIFAGLIGLALVTSSAYAQYYGAPYTTYTCPAGYYLASQSGVPLCYQYPTTSSYVPDIYQPGYTIQYNTTSYGNTAGCLPGYLYSTLTGRRCDSNYNDDYYYSDDYDSSSDATLHDYRISDGDDTYLQEGDDNAEVLTLRFDVEDDDIELDRATFYFEFTGSSSGEDNPWDVFDEITLLSDGDEIDTIDTTDEDEWDYEDNDTYSITFDNLDERIREGDRADISLEVSINSNIGSGDNSWDIYVPDRGIRVRDTDDGTLYTGDEDESVSIEIES